MKNNDFVYAVIADHVSDPATFGSILKTNDKGISMLDRCIQACEDFPNNYQLRDNAVDVTIVLSSNEAVLDAAADLGAVTHVSGSFLSPPAMVRHYFLENDVMIDDESATYIVLVDPLTAEYGNPMLLSGFLKLTE